MIGGYKACPHFYHDDLSITSNVEYINHSMVRRLKRDVLIGVEVEEGSQFAATMVVVGDNL